MKEMLVNLIIQDNENTIVKLLAYISKLLSTGHSFDVVVDKGDKQRERTFMLDGDGADRLFFVGKDGDGWKRIKILEDNDGQK